MTRDVVCISAADGAGGAVIARAVADRLGVRLLAEELIQRAAESAGVDPTVMADVERRRTLLERLVENVGASADAAAFAMVGLPPDVVAASSPEGSGLRNLIRAAIEEAAAEGGGLVIYAHAASVALARRTDVLRVLVTAPEAVRRERLAAERGVTPDAVARSLARSDRARADYLKRFYDVDAEVPVLYDLVVNTDRLEPEEAVELVVAASRGRARPDAAPA